MSRLLRFNEAPIHESGKLLRRAVTSFTSDCFNEAPIHESGKFRPIPREGQTLIVLQ